MTDIFDLRPDAVTHFPAHGWIESSAGVRHLRFPILQTFMFGGPKWQRYSDLGLAGLWLQARSPYKTFRHLSIGLRELHAELHTAVRISEEGWLDREPSDERNQTLMRRDEAIERCEVLLISAFTLLRRLPDDLMEALAPVLFEHTKSAPKTFKKVVEAANNDVLRRAKPFCDPGELASVIMSNSSWFERLRDKGGIRDTLIHWPHLLQIGTHGRKQADAALWTWTASANLMTPNAVGFQHIDVLPILRECLQGACQLMSSLCPLIGGIESYTRGDGIYLTGPDKDAVGFWPPIDSTPRI